MRQYTCTAVGIKGDFLKAIGFQENEEFDPFGEVATPVLELIAGISRAPGPALSTPSAM